VLALAAGAVLPAPRAAADCVSHSFKFASLPFPGGYSAPAAAPRHPDAAAHRPAPPPVPPPCHGPNCRQAPAPDPTPSPVSPRPVNGEDWAWLESRPAPPASAGAAWSGGDGLLAPLSSPTPLEPPPRPF
jgi:hypothetical protein